MLSDEAPPRRRRGRPPGPPKPPKPRKRKPNHETKVGKARLAAIMSDKDDELVSNGGCGRQTVYKKEFAGIARKMCQLGATDADLADAFNVAITTIWRWQSKFPKFAKALEVGKDPADERVVRSLYQR